MELLHILILVISLDTTKKYDSMAYAYFAYIAIIKFIFLQIDEKVDVYFSGIYWGIETI